MAISLEKGRKVNLQKKQNAGLGEILVNLNWNTKPAKQGFFASLMGPKGGIDLDLGCLYELKNGRHLTVGDIAENSGLALPNVSRLLAPAEKQGLIRREKCGRNVNVTLTEEGEKKLAGWLDDFWRDIALALKALTPEETEAFATGFEKMLDSFESRIL